MTETQFTSLTKVREAAAASHTPLVTVVLAVNYGRCTAVEYRRTFNVNELEVMGEFQTDELTATVALLRKYGTKNGKGQLPFSLTFRLDRPAEVWVSAKLVDWMQRQALPRETVPAPLVEQLEVGTANVVAEVVTGTERRAELEALKVTEVRKLASMLKVVGAWTTRKADLIDLIVEAEQATAVA